MDKKQLTRAGIIIGIFVAILALAYGCSVQQANKVKTPSISNPNEVFATIDGYEITNQMLWNEMKGSEGYAYLINYIDNLGLQSFISQVTDAEVAEEIEFIIYGTKDADQIAEVQADAELNQEFIDVFENRFKASGFDPDSDEDRRAYVEEGIAKFAFVKDYLLNASDEDEYAISDADILAYYNQSSYEDACVVPVRFNSQTEGENILISFDLVPNFEGTLATYLPGDLATALEDAGEDGITYISAETALEGEIPNVQELTYEELFDTYIKLYNYTNPWLTPIPERVEDGGVVIEEGISESTYCQDYAETAIYNYSEMTDGYSIGTPTFDLAVYTFTTLNFELEAAPKFSDDLETFGGNKMMVYKVSQDLTQPYSELTDLEKEVLKEKMVDSQLSSGIITTILEILRSEDLEIYDPQMVLLQELDNGDLYDNNGSKTLVAKYGDLDITADTLFDYMKEKAGMYYALELAKRHTLVYSDLYTEEYGKSHNYLESKNAGLVRFQETIAIYKTQYNGGAFIANGIDPSEVSWSEFLYAAFGDTTENGVIENIFVYPSLIMPYVYENLISYESSSAYIQDQFYNYYSMDATHLLIFTDFDGDFAADDFSDLVDGFTPEELLEFNALKTVFEDTITEKLDADMTFAEIVEEFNDSLVTDVENDFAALKAYGFRMKTEALPAINYNTTSALDEDFLSTLLDLYEEYKLPGNVDAEFLLDSSITTSDFGIHKIRITKGEAFDRPSAMFAEADTANPVYSVGSENENDLPTQAQVELYIELQYATLRQTETDITLPQEVIDAIDYYYGPILSASFYIDQQSMGSAGFNIALMEDLLTNSKISFTTDNAKMLAQLEGILEATYYSTFPELYVKLSDLN